MCSSGLLSAGASKYPDCRQNSTFEANIAAAQTLLPKSLNSYGSNSNEAMIDEHNTTVNKAR